MRPPPERIAEIRPPPISPSLQTEFDSLLAKIDAVRKQFDDRDAVGERALPCPSQNVARAPPPRRIPRLGLAILLTGALAAAGGLALAEGGVGRDFRPPSISFDAPSNFFGSLGPVVQPPPQPAPGPRKEGGASRSSVALCVRLCDGFFFPSAGASNDEGCAAQCPDAPTGLYTETSGANQLDDAVSTRDEPYSALPAAHRYRTAYDGACTCHRSPSGFTALALKDPTLRKGDAMMTPGGLVVFSGAKSRSVSRSDFVPVSRAAGLAKGARAALLALTHGSTPPPAGASSPTPPLVATSAPGAPARRRH